MLRRFKNLGWAACLALAVQSVCGFSFWGPPEPWQTSQLSYGPFETPHNLGEEYRWNVPVIYYTIDQSFLDYFGTNGVLEVGKAADLLNATLRTNVNSWSHDLSEFPLESCAYNNTAAALHLFDLKSAMLVMAVDSLLLSDPVAYSWTLRSRVLPPGASCPFYIYGVIKRNFDPVTFEPSVYVNGVLYSYWIAEGCPIVDAAVTVPVQVDTTVRSTQVPVAGLNQWIGQYFCGLSRDDAGGLRYLLNKNNVNIENAGGDTLTYATNYTTTFLYTSNLEAFAQLALTNSDAALAALYPNLAFSAPATNWPVVLRNVLITPYFTNSPFAPVGSLPVVAYTTNYTFTPVMYYRHYFANLEVVQNRNGMWTNFLVSDLSSFTNRSMVTFQTISVSATNQPFAPLGSLALVTNISNHNFVTNDISGEFFLLPTNVCDMHILNNVLTLTNTYTNFLFGATNTIALTNIIGGGNTNNPGGGGGTNNASGTNTETYVQNLLTYSTNHVFLAWPVNCVGTNLAARGGVSSIQFVRRDYDSLINRYWYPITNTWQAPVLSNSVVFNQTISRVVTSPDIVCVAQDDGAGSLGITYTLPFWDSSGVPPNAGGTPPGYNGPGTVRISDPVPTLVFSFTKTGPYYQNTGPLSIDERTAIFISQWGSFDGSTNMPLIYPNNASITNYENQLWMQLFPSTLPNGTVGNPYTFSFTDPVSGTTYNNRFSGSGGQPPYIFSVAPGTALPPGFDQPASPDFVLPNGALTGTPTARGTYGFTIRMTDAGQRSIDVPFTVVIDP